MREKYCAATAVEATAAQDLKILLSPNQGVCQKAYGQSQGDNISFHSRVSRRYTAIFAAMIDLQDITKSFNTGQQSLQVLKGVDMAVDAGEMVAIMGSSVQGSRLC